MSAALEGVGQSHLVRVLKQIFPNERLLLNARRLGGVEYPPTSSYLELDCWLPELRLAFEYQDPHHYVSTWYSNVSQDRYIVRDGFKQRQMTGRGDTLIAIPCWWDGTKESLISTIKDARSDLLPETTSMTRPIPSNPPISYFNRLDVPSVGELMLASFCASSQFDPSLWWMSEKYDGMRVCWDPLHHSLYSKSGKELHLSDSFVQLFPPIFTDGEIWFGRGNFVETSKIVFLNNSAENYENLNPQWSGMRYVAFDCPLPRSSVRTRSAHCEYETRYAELLDVNLDHPLLIVAAIVMCIDKFHLNNFMRSTLEATGEGLILREPKSIYQSGRSSHLIKVKALRDMEGLVIEQNPTYYMLLLPNGKILQIDRDYDENELAEMGIRKGNVVTFSYVTFDSGGIPTFPKINRVRHDVNWRDLVDESSKLRLTVVSNKMLPTRPPPLQYVYRHPRGHWTSHGTRESPTTSSTMRSVEFSENFETSENSGERKDSNNNNNNNNIRAYFDSFAASRNMDPLLPDNWYPISREVFAQTEYGKSVLQHYGNSFIRCVVDVYPDIGLEDHKFLRMRKNYWNEHENVKKFFDRFAAANRFHPVKQYTRWYKVDSAQVQKYTGGKTILAACGSLAAALKQVYPDVAFKDHLFARMQKKYWADPQNRRAFMIRLARKHKFDPLVPDNWYTRQAKIIRSEPGGLSVLQAHGTYIKTLTDLFPDIGLREDLFLHATQYYWRNFDNRRAYFARSATHH